ncbi:MAG: hypothetical protein ACKODR_09920 [Acidimicrobiaceae bacterium]
MEEPNSKEVLPHEQTTPKAKTDRLDLTRATNCVAMVAVGNDYGMLGY